jgi:hypothetical protein
MTTSSWYPHTVFSCGIVKASSLTPGATRHGSVAWLQNGKMYGPLGSRTNA